MRHRPRTLVLIFLVCLAAVWAGLSFAVSLAYADDWRLDRTPAPVSTAYVVDIQQHIRDAELVYRIPTGRLEQLIFCESSFNPWATNGPYHGLGQFDLRTWLWAAPAAGFPGASRYDPVAAIWSTAWGWARAPGRWPNC